MLIGARTKLVLDSVMFNKKCGLCTKYEKCTGSLHNIPKHECIKNYEGPSKAMEAAMYMENDGYESERTLTARTLVNLLTLHSNNDSTASS
ncbi:MAG: hypothetical protein ACK53Y_13840, partial [bacterium]